MGGISMGYRVEQHEYVFADERPFQSCHASTLVVLPNGDIVAAWFAGSVEGADDIAIWCSRRGANGWCAPYKIADEENVPLWNPVLFADSDGTVILYYKVGKEIPRWKTYVQTSQDGGVTWTNPRELVENDESGGRGPVKNKLIVLRDGTWAAPASAEGDLWDAFADLSVDGGATWSRSEWVPLRRADRSALKISDSEDAFVPPVPITSFEGKGVIQPTLWESAPGVVHMLLRSSAGYVYRSDSRDGGRTWSVGYPTELPNNNSGLDLTALDDGTLFVIYNPVKGNWAARTPLVIRMSRDNGSSWSDELVLENDSGEYSYPAIVSQGRTLYLTYTWKRERIAFWKIAVE